jgi:hypothetical protein
MFKLAIVLTTMSAFAFCFLSPTQAMTIGTPTGLAAAVAADESVEPIVARCHQVQRCGPAGCEWRRVCWRGCPDGVSCFPLYGAYGPWGGRAYWGAFSNQYYR